jgi:LPS-assembly protein
VLPRITVESTGQFANGTQIERLALGGRFQPELGKLVNLGYRYTRADLNPTPDPVTGTTLHETLRQVDLSGQWPLLGRYYMVGRVNYSIPDRRSTESVFGFEYNGDCWVLRAVTQSFVTGASQATRVLFLQLELNGMSRLGSNPLEVLKRSVTGYTPLNAPNADQRQPNLYGV